MTGLALYVHWPFCLSKCPYCDFNSHVSGDDIDHAKWRDALLAEMDHFAAETPGRTLTSIFFGGGTPSLMAPDTLAVIVSNAKRHWNCDDIEITAEANPTSVEADKLAAFRDAGVNRLSLGVQSFDDNALKFLGRGHSANEAIAAITLANRLFPAVSFDLIYARPGQTAADWRDEMEQAFQFNTDHLSLYQLSIEPGTPFHKQNVPAAPEDPAVELFDLTAELTDAAGLPAYEISNHARPGSQCRHNLKIWHGQDYIGIGPGAHGRLTGENDATDALFQVHDPARWLESVEKQGHGTSKRRTLAARERLDERIMTGLRTTQGITAELAESLDAEALGRLVHGGFMTRDAQGVRTTATGTLTLNAVLATLLST